VTAIKIVDVVFLEDVDVLDMHARALAAHGGLDGVRERDALSAAVGPPQTAARNGYVTTLADVAASYAFGLARTQTFVDGNKRTAVLAMTGFLGANGYRLVLDPDKWEAIVLAVSTKRLDRDELAALVAEEMGLALGSADASVKPTPVWGTIA
jgi:death-on-curing protein